MKSSFKLKGLSPDSDKKLNQAVVEGLKAKLRLPAGLYVTYRPADEQAEIFTPVEAIQGTDRVKQYLKVDYQEEVAVYANSDTVLDLKQATLESNLFADGDRITIDAYSSPVTRKLEITFCSHKRNWLEDIKTELSKSIVLKDSVSVTYPVDENTVEFMDHLRRTKANKVTPDSSWNTIDKYFPIDKRTVSSNCVFTSKVTFVSNITENSMYFLTVKLDVTYNHVLWLVVSYPPVLNNTLINPKYLATDVVYSTEVKDIVKEIGKGHSRYLLDPKDTFLNIPVTDTWFTARVSRKYTPLVTVLLTLGTNRKNLGKLKDLPGIKITEAYLNYIMDTDSKVTKGTGCVFKLDLFENDTLYPDELTLEANGDLTTSTNLNYENNYRIVLSLVKDIEAVSEEEYTKLLKHLEPAILDFKNNNKDKTSNLLTYDGPMDNKGRVYDIKKNYLIDKDNDAVSYTGDKLKDMPTLKVDTEWVSTNDNSVAEATLVAIQKLPLPENYHTGIPPTKVIVVPAAMIEPGIKSSWGIAKPLLTITGNVSDITTMDGTVRLSPYTPLSDYPGTHTGTEWIFDNGIRIKQDDDLVVSNIFDKLDLFKPGSSIKIKARYKSDYTPAPKESPWTDVFTFPVPEYGIAKFEITLKELNNKEKLEIQAPFVVKQIHPVGPITKVESKLTILDDTNAVVHTETVAGGKDKFVIELNTLTIEKNYKIQVEHKVANATVELFNNEVRKEEKEYLYTAAVTPPAIDKTKWKIKTPTVSYGTGITSVDDFDGILYGSNYAVEFSYPGSYDLPNWVIEEDGVVVHSSNLVTDKQQIDLSALNIYKPSVNIKAKLKHVSNYTDHPLASDFGELSFTTPNFGVKQPSFTIEESTDKQFVIVKPILNVEEWNVLGSYVVDPYVLEIKDQDGVIVKTINSTTNEIKVPIADINVNKDYEYKLTTSISSNRYYVDNHVNTNSLTKVYKVVRVASINSIDKPTVQSLGYIPSDPFSFMGIFQLSNCNTDKGNIIPTKVEWVIANNTTSVTEEKAGISNNIFEVLTASYHSIVSSIDNSVTDDKLDVKARYVYTENGVTINSPWSHVFTIPVPKNIGIQDLALSVKQVKAGENGSSVTGDKYKLTPTYYGNTNHYGNFYDQLVLHNVTIEVREKATDTLVKTFTNNSLNFTIEESSSNYIPLGKEYRVKAKVEWKNKFLAAVTNGDVGDRLKKTKEVEYNKVPVVVHNWAISKPTLTMAGYNITDQSTLLREMQGSVYTVEDDYPGTFDKYSVSIAKVLDDGTTTAETITEYSSSGNHATIDIMEFLKDPIEMGEKARVKVKYKSTYTSHPLESDWSDPLDFHMPDLGISSLTGTVTLDGADIKVSASAEAYDMPLGVVGSYSFKKIEAKFLLNGVVKHTVELDNDDMVTFAPSVLEEGKEYKVVFKATLDNALLASKNLHTKEESIDYTVPVLSGWKIRKPVITATGIEDLTTFSGKITSSAYVAEGGYPGTHDGSRWIIKDKQEEVFRSRDDAYKSELDLFSLKLFKPNRKMKITLEHISDYLAKPLVSPLSDPIEFNIPDFGVKDTVIETEILKSNTDPKVKIKITPDVLTYSYLGTITQKPITYILKDGVNTLDTGTITGNEITLSLKTIPLGKTITVEVTNTVANEYFEANTVSSNTSSTTFVNNYLDTTNWSINKPVIEAIPTGTDFLNWEGKLKASAYSVTGEYPGTHKDTTWLYTVDTEDKSTTSATELTEINMIAYNVIQQGKSYTFKVKYRSDYKYAPMESEVSDGITLAMPKLGILEPEVTVELLGKKVAIKAPYKEVEDPTNPILVAGTRVITITNKNTSEVIKTITQNNIPAKDTTGIEVDVTDLVANVPLDIKVEHKVDYPLFKAMNVDKASKSVEYTYVPMGVKTPVLKFLDDKTEANFKGKVTTEAYDVIGGYTGTFKESIIEMLKLPTGVTTVDENTNWSTAVTRKETTVGTGIDVKYLPDYGIFGNSIAYRAKHIGTASGTDLDSEWSNVEVMTYDKPKIKLIDPSVKQVGENLVIKTKVGFDHFWKGMLDPDDTILVRFYLYYHNDLEAELINAPLTLEDGYYTYKYHMKNIEEMTDYVIEIAAETQNPDMVAMDVARVNQHFDFKVDENPYLENNTWKIEQPTISFNADYTKLLATPYTPLGGYPGARVSTTWAMNTRNDFDSRGQVVYGTYESSEYASQFPIDPKTFLKSPGGTYYARVKYIGRHEGKDKDSGWSNVLTYNVPNFGIKDFNISITVENGKATIKAPYEFIEAPGLLQTPNKLASTFTITNTKTKEKQIYTVAGDTLILTADELDNHNRYLVLVEHKVDSEVLKSVNKDVKKATNVFNYDLEHGPVEHTKPECDGNVVVAKHKISIDMNERALEIGKFKFECVPQGTDPEREYTGSATPATPPAPEPILPEPTPEEIAKWDIAKPVLSTGGVDGTTVALGIPTYTPLHGYRGKLDEVIWEYGYGEYPDHLVTVTNNTPSTIGNSIPAYGGAPIGKNVKVWARVKFKSNYEKKPITTEWSDVETYLTPDYGIHKFSIEVSGEDKLTPKIKPSGFRPNIDKVLEFVNDIELNNVVYTIKEKDTDTVVYTETTDAETEFITVPSGKLVKAKTYKIEVEYKYTSQYLNDVCKEEVEYETPTPKILKPLVNIRVNEATEDIYLEGSPYKTEETTEQHTYSSWWLYEENNETPIATLLNTPSNLTTWSVKDKVVANKKYKAKLQYYSNSLESPIGENVILGIDGTPDDMWSTMVTYTGMIPYLEVSSYNVPGFSNQVAMKANVTIRNIQNVTNQDDYGKQPVMFQKEFETGFKNFRNTPMYGYFTVDEWKTMHNNKNYGDRLFVETTIEDSKGRIITVQPCVYKPKSFEDETYISVRGLGTANVVAELYNWWQHDASFLKTTNTKWELFEGDTPKHVYEDTGLQSTYVIPNTVNLDPTKEYKLRCTLTTASGTMVMNQGQDYKFKPDAPYATQASVSVTMAAVNDYAWNGTLSIYSDPINNPGITTYTLTEQRIRIYDRVEDKLVFDKTVPSGNTFTINRKTRNGTDLTDFTDIQLDFNKEYEFRIDRSYNNGDFVAEPTKYRYKTIQPANVSIASVTLNHTPTFNEADGVRKVSYKINEPYTITGHSDKECKKIKWSLSVKNKEIFSTVTAGNVRELTVTGGVDVPFRAMKYGVYYIMTVTQYGPTKPNNPYEHYTGTGSVSFTAPADPYPTVNLDTNTPPTGEVVNVTSTSVTVKTSHTSNIPATTITYTLTGSTLNGLLARKIRNKEELPRGMEIVNTGSETSPNVTALKITLRGVESNIDNTVTFTDLLPGATYNISALYKYDAGESLGGTPYNGNYTYEKYLSATLESGGGEINIVPEIRMPAGSIFGDSEKFVSWIEIYDDLRVNAEYSILEIREGGPEGTILKSVRAEGAGYYQYTNYELPEFDTDYWMTGYIVLANGVRTKRGVYKHHTKPLNPNDFKNRIESSYIARPSTLQSIRDAGLIPADANPIELTNYDAWIKVTSKIAKYVTKIEVVADEGPQALEVNKFEIPFKTFSDAVPEPTTDPTTYKWTFQIPYFNWKDKDGVTHNWVLARCNYVIHFNNGTTYNGKWW